MNNISARFFFREALPTEEDYLIYLKIKSDEDAIKYSGFKTAPDPEKFRGVFNRIMEDPKQHLLYLCDKENNDTVASSFHYQENDSETVEGLGYNVFPEYRGLGLGGVMMRLVNDRCASEGFKYRLSIVAESNIPSIKNLEKSGAYPTGKFEMRWLDALGREEKYLFYIKEL